MGQSLEQQLFTWDSWDGDQEMMIYYNVVLVDTLLDHPKGNQFDSAIIHFTTSKLELRRGGEIFTYQLHLSVS